MLVQECFMFIPLAWFEWSSEYFGKYGYISLGTVLVLMNSIIFVSVIGKRSLRKRYLIMAFLIVNDGLAGFVALITGTKRILMKHSEKSQIAMSNKECLYGTTLILLLCTVLNAAGLLAHGIVRLLAITVPVYFYHNSLKVEKYLLCFLYTVAITPILAAVIYTASEPPRNITIYCKMSHIFDVHTYLAVLFIRTFYTFLSIVIILAIVCNMKRYHRKVIASSGKDSNSQRLFNFLADQRRITTTMIFSACITFFLFVVPTTAQIFLILYTQLGSIGHINSLVVTLSLLNSLNTFVLLLCRQQDLQASVREILCRLFINNTVKSNSTLKFLASSTGKRNVNVQPIYPAHLMR